MSHTISANPSRNRLIWKLCLIAGLLLLGWLTAQPAAAQGPTNVPGGTISGSVTWTLADSPYIVQGNVTVANGGSLTIEPGVEIRLNTDRWISVLGGGTLTAEGEEAAPITFAANGADPWRYLYFYPNATVRLTHCDVSGAGRSNYAALDINSSDVEVRNCRIHSNQDEGVEISGSGRSPLLADSVIENNGGVAIQQSTFDMTPRYQNLTLQGNGTDAVVSPGATLGRHVTLDGPGGLNGRPFILTTNVTVAAGQALTVTAGSEVRLDGDRWISMLGGGALTAQGTAAQPITFTANLTEPVAGHWRYLYFYPNAEVRLNHCVVEYAGRSNYAALDIRSSDVEVRNCRIHSNQDEGVEITGSGLSPLLADSVIENNGGVAIQQSTFDMTPRYQNLTLRDNGTDAVVSPGATLGRHVTLDGPGGLNGRPFILTTNVTVAAGQALTVTAGSEVRLDGDRWISMLGGGALIAQGTAAQPITFTANLTEPVAGHWRYLYFYPNAEARLNHCVVEYAGRSNYAALDINSSDVEVRNCRIHSNQDEGVEISGSGRSPLLADSVIENNGGVAIQQSTFDMTPRYQNLTLQGNGTDAVVSPGASLGRHVTLDGPGGLNGRPFILTTNVTVAAGQALTVTAGSEVRLNGDRWISVLGGGALIAQGTAAQPITFTANLTEPVAGHWRYLYFYPNAEARLNHCVVEYAGRSNSAALDIRSSTVEVRNCHIHNNQSRGALISGSGLSPLLADSVIENNGGVAIQQSTLDMTPRYQNLTLRDNGTDAVLSPGGTLNRDVTLDSLGGLNGRPFIVTGNVTVAAERTLRLRPGSEVRFDGSRTLFVQNRGALIAQGTAAQPVVFTSHATEPAAGDWNQISVAAGASAQLRHCVVAFSAQGLTANSRLLIDSCTFRDNNRGVGVAGNAGGTIVNSQFIGNAVGVNNTTPAAPVRAFGNWWNHPSGPSHSANPEGQGDPVSDGVLYQGWLNSGGGAATGRQATPLILGQTVDQSMDASQIHDFVYAAAGGENLLLEVRPANAAARLYLLSRLGALPWVDMLDSDVAAHTAIEGVYLIPLPDAAAGDHFFTLLPALTSPATAYSLTLLDAENRMAAVTPGTVGPAPATLTAHGLFNLDEAEARLCRPGSPAIRTGLLHALDNSQSRISLDLTDVAPGVYDLCVTWPDGSQQTLTGSLTVEPGNPQVRVWMENPRFVRAARRYTGYLHIASVGNVPAPAPYVTIDAVNARLSLWSDGAKSSQVRLYGFNDQSPFGLLPPGTERRIPIYMEVTSNDDVILTIKTVNESSQEAFDWGKLEASLRPAPIPANWSNAWAEATAAFGNTWGSVIREVNRNANQMASVPQPASPDNLLATWLYNAMIGVILDNGGTSRSAAVTDQAVKLVCGTTPTENLYTYDYDAQSDVKLPGFNPATFDENQPTFIVIHGLHQDASDMQQVVNALDGRGNIIVVEWEVGAKISTGLIFSIVQCRTANGTNGPRLAGLVAETKLRAALNSAGKRLNTDNTTVIARDAGIYLGMELFRFAPGTPAAVWLNPTSDINLMRQVRPRFDGDRSAAITVPSAPTDALVSEIKTHLNWPTFWALPGDEEGGVTIPDWAQQRDHAPAIFVEWPPEWPTLCPFWKVDDEEEEENGPDGLAQSRAFTQGEEDDDCLASPTYPIPPQEEETPSEVKRPTLDDEQPEDPAFTDEQEERIPSLNSWDPNEKEAWVQYAMPGDVVRWTIHFENMETATAPAQEVFIRDQLPAELDWSSVRMLEVGFDRYSVPFTARGNATTLRESILIPDYRPEVTDLIEVRVDAFINPQTGELNWAFTTLDPRTGDYPEDPLAGFLPPNDSTGRGEGYVVFETRIRPDVPLNTPVHNEADIIFDINPPINTGVETIIAGPDPATIRSIYLPLITTDDPALRHTEAAQPETIHTQIYLPILGR